MISTLFTLSVPTLAQGLLGKTAMNVEDDVGGSQQDLALLDIRSRLLRIPNMSQPPCSLEIGKSFSADTKSQGLQVISRFRTEDEIIGVVAQIARDESTQIDAKTREFHKLFENQKYVFLVHFQTEKMDPARDFDSFLYIPLFAQLGEVPGLALRPKDKKFILATQKSDFDRIHPQRNKNIYAGKVSFEEYKKKLYPIFRLRELEFFAKNDLPLIENGIRDLEKVDKDFKDMFKAKVKALKDETNACKKIVNKNLK